MRTVADLTAAEMPLLWHEAVALVQEIAHASAGQPIPSAEDILVEEDGTISFAFASEEALPPVVVLGRTLHSLLRDDAPAPLKAFAAENAGEQPSHPTVESFTRALAFFERPGRAGHLLAVAARLQNIPRAATATPEEELARLRERVAEAPVESRTPITAAVLGRKIQPRYALVGGVVVVAFLTLATLGWRGIGKVGGGERAAAAAADLTPAAGAHQDPAPAADADGVDRSDAKSTRTGAVPVSKDASRSTARRRSVDAAREPLPRVAAYPNAANGRRGRPSADRSAPTTGTTAETRSAAPPFETSRVYSSADATVTPAVFLRPQMPSAPSTARPTGYFDLTVDQEGSVETVRLISPASRYQERLLVSAAKAWRFRPALLAGKPVKYRMRIPITVPVQQ